MNGKTYERRLLPPPCLFVSSSLHSRNFNTLVLLRSILHQAHTLRLLHRARGSIPHTKTTTSLIPHFSFKQKILPFCDGYFTPSSFEEIVGILGAKQNCLIVATQVRNSIIQSKADHDLIAAFDSVRAAELLYEIRFPEGCVSFDYKYSDDCLVFMCLRLGRESGEGTEQWAAAFARVLEAAVMEDARQVVEDEILGKGTDRAKGKVNENDRVRVPVVRMRMGDVAEASSMILLPICKGEEGELAEAPREARGSGEFGGGYGGERVEEVGGVVGMGARGRNRWKGSGDGVCGRKCFAMKSK